MSQMTAHAQIQTQDFVPRLENRKHHSVIRLRTTMRLHVGITAIENFFQTVNSQLF